MREVVGQTTFDRAVTVGRQEIEQRTKALMQGILDAYQSGILIANVQLQKSDPPKEVIDAFNDVQRARQDRDRLPNSSEERRVGKACVSKRRSRWSPYHKKKNK